MKKHGMILDGLIRIANIIVWSFVVGASLGLLAGLLTGCQPEQQSTQVWGRGELPAEYLGFFGNDNMARLNFVQTQRINQFNQQIIAFAKENAEQHKIMAQSDIDLYARVRVLENQPIVDSDSLQEATEKK